jgi:hypothetical protein
LRRAWPSTSLATPNPGSRNEGAAVDFTDHPFLHVMWTMFIIWIWVAWFWLLISVFGDVFRRRDLSGAAKASWAIIILILPFIGSLVYLVSQGGNMAERRQT